MGNGKKFKTDKPTMAEIIAAKRPNKRSVDIPTDPEIALKITQKEAEIEQAMRAHARKVGQSLADGSPAAELAQLEEELEALWDEAADSIVTFTFQDIGRKKYDDLVTAHPPTDEQKEEWKANGGEGTLAYNVETFPTALIAAASFEPKITVKQADQIFEDWGNGECQLLFGAATAACLGMAAAPKSRRSQSDTDETSSSD